MLRLATRNRWTSFSRIWEKTQPHIYAYNGVIDGYGKNGMIKQMESVDVIEFITHADSYGRKQTSDKMEQVFKSLLRSKERPTHPTFNSMITNYGKASLRDKVESVLEKLDESGFKPNYVPKSVSSICTVL